MGKKGTITEVDETNRKAKVTFIDLDNSTTSLIPYARHINDLQIGDYVVVIFFFKQYE